MRQNMKNDDGGPSRLLGQLAADKKKAGIALCLIAVMAIMWIKVLTKKGPQSAEAGVTVEQTQADAQLIEKMKISYLSLPDIPGRNDIIGTDVFDAQGWEGFDLSKGIDNPVDIIGIDVELTDVKEEVATKIGQLMKLQAIGLGENPQAFINDILLAVADKMIVSDGTEIYECEVIEISQNSVLVRCRGVGIRLKLVETVDGDG